MFHVFYLFAGTAGEARLSRRDRFFTIQGLGESQSKSPATDAGRTGKEIRMPRFPARHMPAKHIHSPFMPEKIPIISHQLSVVS
jgi:hypothetical protein